MGATVGESVSIVALGSIIGTAVALVTIYLFNMLWVPLEWEPITREVVFTNTAIVTVVASIVCLLITPLVSSALAERSKLDVPASPRVRT